MSRLIEELHELSKDMYAAGVIDKNRMLEHEALYRAALASEYTGEQIKEIRDRLNLSQTGFASIISTSKSTVRAWEEGKRKPRGPVCLLLDLLNRKGLDALL